MLEQALFISKLSHLKYLRERYSRIYFGNEFCQRLIPSVFDLKKVLEYTRKKRLNFSLATPYVTEYGLRKLEILFDLLTEAGFDSEVIVNDWGVLDLVSSNYPGLRPVLGRLLTKQKRGPRLMKLLKRDGRPRLIIDPRSPDISHLVFQKRLPLALDPYYRGSNASSVPIIHNYLIDRGIKRIELDNTLQGLSLELPEGEISASLYLPYIYISTTFFCPTAGCDQKRSSLLKIKPCNRQCQKYIFKLRHKTMPKTLFLKGNTIFYKHSRLPAKNLQEIGIDRIVREPEIPI